MTIYTTIKSKHRKCSCLSCKKEMTTVNFSRHIATNKCHIIPVCKYCGITLSQFKNPANHVNWCSYRPNLAELKLNKSKQLNASWEVDKDSRIRKVKSTKFEKFGDENYVNIEKIRTTKLELYGDENYNNRDKAAETCMLIYGVPNQNMNEDIKQKSINTCLEKYGVTHTLKLDKCRPSEHDRARARETSKMTYLKLYGVEYPAQVPEIHAKMQSHRNTNKVFTFPSGKSFTVQGYEPIAIQELLDAGYEEYDIQLKDRKAIKYIFEGEHHYYHPDIIIPKENRIIEVKSKYWFNKEYDKNMAKQTACVEQGYNFEFKIY